MYWVTKRVTEVTNTLVAEATDSAIDFIDDWKSTALSIFANGTPAPIMKVLIKTASVAGIIAPSFFGVVLTSLTVLPSWVELL